MPGWGVVALFLGQQDAINDLNRDMTQWCLRTSDPVVLPGKTQKGEGSVQCGGDKPVGRQPLFV